MGPWLSDTPLTEAVPYRTVAATPTTWARTHRTSMARIKAPTVVLQYGMLCVNIKDAVTYEFAYLHPYVVSLYLRFFTMGRRISVGPREGQESQRDPRYPAATMSMFRCATRKHISRVCEFCKARKLRCRFRGTDPACAKCRSKGLACIVKGKRATAAGGRLNLFVVLSRINLSN